MSRVSTCSIALAFTAPLWHAPVPQAPMQRAPAAQEPAPRIVDERPSPMEVPRIPPLQIEGEPAPPATRPLARNLALVDRFTAEGQSVRYPFEARQGELSIFELACLGYARGWQATAGVRLLDGAGVELVALERSGGASFRKFLAFVAPADGTYELELRAAAQYFRYSLQRHSDYVSRAPGSVLAFGQRDALHGWLADADDAATYALQLTAGQEVLLAVRNTQEQARRQMRTQRRRQPWEVVRRRERGLAGAGAPAGEAPERMSRAMNEAMGPMRDRRGGGSTYPRLVLELARGGTPLTPRAPSTLFTAPETGTYHLTVRATGGGEGGLFDLVLEREVAKSTVHGVVADAEDEPVAGVTLHFLREPELDYLGRALTDESGAYRIALPPGPYTVLLDGGRLDGVRPQSLRAEIRGERELNAILLGR